MDGETTQPLFKNLALAGLPESGEEWHPENFLTKWVGILHKSKHGQTLDLLNESCSINFKTEDGEDAAIFASNTKPLNAIAIEKLFSNALVIFMQKMDTLSKDEKAAFAYSQLEVLETHSKVTLPYPPNDGWGKTEAYMYNEYRRWVLKCAASPNNVKEVKRGKKTKLISLPALFKDKDEFKMVNDWLFNEEFLLDVHSDTDRPYRLDGAKKVEVEQKNEHSIKRQQKRKIKTLKLKYVIAALGNFLSDHDCFDSRNCENTTIARSILSYFTDIEVDYDPKQEPEKHKAFEIYRKAFENVPYSYTELFSDLELELDKYRENKKQS